MKQINIGISEFDVELFKTVVYNNGRIKWTYVVEGTEEEITVNFMSEDELNQMED
jgi:hypothetical protein